MKPLFGLYSSNALAAGERLTSYGVDAVWFHAFDEKSFDACARLGLSACVEFPTWRADFNRHPELIPVGVDGLPIRYGTLVQGICLSNRDFVEERMVQLADGLKRYRPDGVWLDYMSYSGWFETPDPDLQESCFCKSCVAEFCQAEGVSDDDPQTILNRHGALWARHKCGRIAELTGRMSAMIRSQHAGCAVGIYLCPWRPDEYDGALTRIFAQDPALLEPSIDVFTPLIYAAKSGRESVWGRRYLETAHAWIPHGKKVQLILDALDFPDSLAETAESSVPSWGVQIFAGGPLLADPRQASFFARAIERIRRKLPA